MAPVNLDSKSLDQLERLVATEVDHRLAWTHPEEYSAQVKGVVDTVLNRVASGKWGDTVAEVANAKKQFSAINGPKTGKYKVYGNVDAVPDSVVPGFMRNIVSSWVQERAMGAPDTVGGGLNYANPKFSDASNLGWINALDGPQLGYGDSTHVHGTVKGLTPVRSTVRLGPEGAPFPANKSAIVKAQQTARSADYSYLPMQPQGSPPVRRGIASGGAALGQTVPAEMSVTPNINGTSNQPIPSSAYVDARRSLFSNQPIAETGLAGDTMNRGGSFAPYTLPNMPPWMVTKPNPDSYSPTMPVGGPVTVNPGSMPGAMPTIPLPRKRPATPTSVAEAAPVPMPRSARPKSQPAATPAAAKQMTTVNGKTAEVGSLYNIGGATWKVVVDSSGKGKLEKLDLGLLGEMGKDTIVGGAVDRALGDAIGGAGKSITEAVNPALADVGAKASEMAGQAGSFLTNLFGGGNKPASQPAAKPVARPAATPTFQPGMLGRASASPAAIPKPQATPLTGFGGMTGTAPRPVAAPAPVAPITKYRQIINPTYLDYVNAQKANVMSGAGMLGSAKNTPLPPYMPTSGPGTFAVAPNTAKPSPPPQYIQQAYTVPAAPVAQPVKLPVPAQTQPAFALPNLDGLLGQLFKYTPPPQKLPMPTRIQPGSRGTAAGNDGARETNNSHSAGELRPPGHQLLRRPASGKTILLRLVHDSGQQHRHQQHQH